MIRTFVVEFIFPLLLFLLVRSMIRNFIQSTRGKAAQSAPQSSTAQVPTVPVGGELKKDPVCGTYVSTAASVTRTVHGQVMHFCSKECRDKYLAA